MTLRRESMPCLSGAEVRWDVEASKVRYFACFEGADEWIEVPGEDFDRLTRLFAQESIDVVCEAITTTLDHVNATLTDFSAFRGELEKLAKMNAPVPEGTGN